MALTTPQNYIYQALRKCGMLRPASNAGADFLADCMTELGSLYDFWAAERTMGFSIPQLEFDIQAPGSQQNGNGYLIGPVVTFSGTLAIGSKVISAVSNPAAVQVGEAISGTGIAALARVGSFDQAAGTITMTLNATANGVQTITGTPDLVAPRPESIVRANCVMLNTGTQPVYIPMNPLSAEQWANLAIRQIPAINVTTSFYYDPQYPNGVLNVFPPLLGNGIELFVWGALPVPATLTSPMLEPPGYQDAIVWSLAERLWPMATLQQAVNRIPHAYICGKAYEACQKVRAVNRPIPTMKSDFRGGQRPQGYYDSFVSWTGLPT